MHMHPCAWQQDACTKCAHSVHILHHTQHSSACALRPPFADDRSYMQSARTALLQCLDKMSLQDEDRLTVVDFNSSQNAWWSSECSAAAPGGTWWAPGADEANRHPERLAICTEITS